jgi:DNA-directed RNA polymerase subunit RPC12/RpoP
MKETEAKYLKGKGAMEGCNFGCGAAGFVIIVGGLLTATGIGAIIGIPLIIVGFILPFLTTFMGYGGLKGKCPWCETEIENPYPLSGMDCPACKKRIVIRGNKFVKIE